MRSRSEARSGCCSKSRCRRACRKQSRRPRLRGHEPGIAARVSDDCLHRRHPDLLDEQLRLLAVPTPTAEGLRVASVAAAHHRYAAVAFLGSGTTVIAAERSGRRCCALELDPGYVEGHASGLGTIRPASRSPAGPPVLGRNAEGALTAIRTPEPGELYRYHLGRLACAPIRDPREGGTATAPAHEPDRARRLPGCRAPG